MSSVKINSCLIYRANVFAVVTMQPVVVLKVE
jgi:hypothetical protein